MVRPESTVSQQLPESTPSSDAIDGSLAIDGGGLPVPEPEEEGMEEKLGHSRKQHCLKAIDICEK